MYNKGKTLIIIFLILSLITPQLVLAQANDNIKEGFDILKNIAGFVD